MSMTLKEIKEDVLRKLNIEQPESAPASTVSDVLHAINQAFQLLNVAGNPFWRETTDTLSFSGSTAQTVTGVQRVNKVVNANGRELLRAADEYKVKYAHEVYFGELTAGTDYNASVYCVTAQMDGTTESAVLKVHAGPQPLVAQDLTVHYLATFTPYTKDDLEKNFAVVSVPYKYIELLILPIARFYVSRSTWFSRRDEGLLKRLQEDFDSAMTLLASANPELPVREPKESQTV